MVFSQEGMRHLVAEMGVSQVLYGTDIRSPRHGRTRLARYPGPDSRRASLSDADKEAIVGGNLVELLRLEA